MCKDRVFGSFSIGFSTDVQFGVGFCIAVRENKMSIGMSIKGVGLEMFNALFKELFWRFFALMKVSHLKTAAGDLVARHVKR